MGEGTSEGSQGLPVLTRTILGVLLTQGVLESTRFIGFDFKRPKERPKPTVHQSSRYPKLQYQDKPRRISSHKSALIRSLLDLRSDQCLPCCYHAEIQSQRV